MLTLLDPNLGTKTKTGCKNNLAVETRVRILEKSGYMAENAEEKRCFSILAGEL